MYERTKAEDYSCGHRCGDRCGDRFNAGHSEVGCVNVTGSVCILRRITDKLN